MTFRNTGPAEWIGPRAWQSDGVTKTQYYTATSLDGYIADEHNSLDWLFEVDRAEGDDQSFTRFFADVGAMAMGTTTYEWVLDHDHLLDHPEKWNAYYGETPSGSSRIGRCRGFREWTSGSSRETFDRCTRR